MVLFMSSILPMDWEKWVITEVTLHSKGITQAKDVLPPLSTRINHVANDSEECSIPVELVQAQNRLFS